MSKDKFEESGPWDVTYEGEAIALEGEEYASHVRVGTPDKIQDIVTLPERDLRIASGRKVKIIVKVQV